VLQLRGSRPQPAYGHEMRFILLMIFLGTYEQNRWEIPRESGVTLMRIGELRCLAPPRPDAQCQRHPPQAA